MANYYLGGYTPPSGVDSASKVKEYQRQLGVKADGIWGPLTEAAYQKSVAPAQAQPATGGFNWGGATGGQSTGNAVFDSYYNSIRNGISAPTVSVSKPSETEVSSMWRGILRPAAESAIENRNEAAEENMAELDADAASRGMGASSYLTSMKARELNEAQDDIGDIEAQYGAQLAERIYDTLYKYDQLAASAERYNADAYASAQSSALKLASDWYSSYLAQQQAAAKAASQSKSSSGSSSSSAKKSGLSAADYTEYVQNLTSAQRKLLFGSTADYWTTRRDEIYSALGSARFETLRKKYGA